MTLAMDQAVRIGTAENVALQQLATAHGALLRVALPPSHCSIFRTRDDVLLAKAARLVDEVLCAAEQAQRDLYEAANDSAVAQRKPTREQPTKAIPVG